MTKAEKMAARRAAVAAGERVYRTGVACSRGHDAPRYVSNNACVECMAANSATWKAANSERYGAALSAWRRGNRERVSSAHRRWLAENRNRVVVHKASRRARKRSCGGRLSHDIIERLMRLQRGRCAGCRARLRAYHLDHIAPLALGGENADANVQLLCVPCNLSKHAKPPHVFMQSMGFLL